MPIYKYLAVPAAIEERERLFKNLLADRMIRFTRLKDLNDPFECIPTIHSAIKILERNETQVPEFWHLSPGQQAKRLQEIRGIRAYYHFGRQRDDLLATIQSSHAFLSLSKFAESDFCSSVPMWSHYAGQHKGFVIEFHESHPWFNRAKDVIYTYKPADWPTSEPAMHRLLLTKSNSWSVEREIRIIAKSSECVNIGPGLIGQQFPRDAIRRIIIGARMDPKAGETLRKYNPGYEIAFARINGESFRIDLFSY